MKGEVGFKEMNGTYISLRSLPERGGHLAPLENKQSQTDNQGEETRAEPSRGDERGGERSVFKV